MAFKVKGGKQPLVIKPGATKGVQPTENNQPADGGIQSSDKVKQLRAQYIAKKNSGPAKPIDLQAR